MSHPYQGLPAHQFHSSGVAGQHPAFFDPVTAPKFTLVGSGAIATMGSCFAQNLSRWLVAKGHPFLATEPSHENAGGLFSANFGNVYTVAQAAQLLRFAFGQERPSDEAWRNDADKFIDPLRPGATRAGFDSAADMVEARRRHYAAVRLMFMTAPTLVFTLGLTEAWQRKTDGAVLPLAPGVAGGVFDPSTHQFVNFSYQEVSDDLAEFIRSVTKINPAVRILLTVSPVPLAATYEPRHVAVSTMASKAVLRAAVDAVLPLFANVDYFPSFEIFYTPGIATTYFDADCRHVTPAGVAHAMRVFERHYLGGRKGDQQAATVQAAAALKAHYDVWCDEEGIVRS